LPLLQRSPLGAPNCEMWLIPIRQNFLRLDDLVRRTGKTEFQFSGLARDLDFDGFEAVALHAGMELFVGFAGAVLLEAVAHD
jgi:hypothetical protein